MKKFLCFITILSLLLSIPLSAQAAETAPISRDDITVILKTLGIMEGHANGNLGYAETLTRAQFAKMAVMSSVYRDSVSETSRTSPFSDVKNTHWAASYIAVAAKNGLIKGYAKGDFRPERAVLYEEAVTVCLRLLGYRDEDLSSGYPLGQLAMANSIGLTDHVGGVRGQPLTRERTARLIYNLLSTKPKNGLQQPTYYQSLGYQLIGSDLTAEAVVSEHMTGPVAITASAGLSTLGLDLSKTIIYKNGGLISASAVQNGNVAYYSKKAGIIWIYDEQVTGVVTAVNTTAQSAVSVVVDGKPYALTSDTARALFAKNGVAVGQLVTLTLDRDGGAGYARLAFLGPVVYRSGNSLGSLGVNLSTATIYRNDKVVSAADLTDYDLVYFDPEQNTIWAYDKKASGILESIQPNRVSPTEVSINGKIYTLSGDKAKEAFGATGFSAGDMVTLLLDYSGNVFDAYLTRQVYSQVQGVVTASGIRQFPTANSVTSVSYYATLLTLSGNTMDVKLASSADSYLSRAVQVDFSKNPIGINGLSSSGTQASGQFNWDTRTLGSAKLSKNLSVLEVDSRGHYGPVVPDRLDGVRIDSGSALLANRNTSGEIVHLVLRNVTGDFLGYGIVTSVVEINIPSTPTTPDSVSSVYGYDMAGTPGMLNLPNQIWHISKGPSMFVIEKDNSISSIKPLIETDGTVSSVNPLWLKTSTGKTYKVSNRVAAYKYMDGTYVATHVDDAAACTTTRAYYDKPESDGGCVRVIIGY